ncbi:hypothetical protein ACIA98_35205 [Streptomyces sp. NPDC051366]|uniref:hypothetical protein n=1 Tax=Streptomyces sp. NPDC051366 TaxID=3365652 RepID=UPI0037BB50B9
MAARTRCPSAPCPAHSSKAAPTSRAYLAYEGDEVAAVSLTLRQGKRLFAKWASFDYEALGGRSGIYSASSWTASQREAYAEDATSLAAGPGASEVKGLRGFKPHQIRSAIPVTDIDLRAEGAKVHAALGEARREAPGAATDEEPKSAISRPKAKPPCGSAYEPIQRLQPVGGCWG